MKLFTKTIATIGLSVGALAFASGAFAAGVNVNANANDVAIHGYDPVAYFKKSAPVEGSAKFTASHKDAIYYFSSKSNRNLFKENPEKYAPAFGGYCAYGVALDKKFDTDPEAWKIVDGKLYLNLNKKVQKRWSEDIPGHIETANDNWGEIEFLSKKEIDDRG